MEPARRSERQATTIVTAGGRVVAVRVRALTIEAVAGPAAGARAELAGRELSIGSAPDNHLVLADPRVSRYHCRVLVDERAVKVRDTGSANGTFVAGVRVRDADLPVDARLEVGDTRLAVRWGDGERELELSPDERFGGAVGRSVAMRELFALARRAAATDASVLLLGETGTGKEVLARAIHDHSRRAAAPFVVFDCGAVASTLIESALFGHVRGAFTGADRDHPGVFERAHGGTLFLDEIGELDPSLQPKLLRALEAGRITRVGAVEEQAVDVRIVAATHRDVRGEVDAGRFRADLYYRLAVIPLEVPALRERPEDIPLIAAHLLERVLDQNAGDLERVRAHLDTAFGELARYPWPGNVRELRNVIERAAVLIDPAGPKTDVFTRLVELRGAISQTLHVRPPLEEARANFDREYLRDVLEAAQGDVARAAERAGIHPKSFSRLLRRHGVVR